MRRPERVVFALGPFGEPGKAAALPHGADAVAPASENLVGIGLVPDIPDQAIRGGVEHIVYRNGQLDHPKPRAQMAARYRDRADGLVAQLVGKLAQLAARKLPKRRGFGYLVQQRRFGSRHGYRLTSTRTARRSQG